MKLMRRWYGFKDDDGRYQWESIRRHLRSRCYVVWWRIDNRWQDARAVLAGSCNATTWTGEGMTGYAGGYSHWRCGKRRGHHLQVPRGVTMETGDYGPHRFINYTWSGDPGDRVQYNPMPIRNEDNTGWFDTRKVIPFRKLSGGRHAVDRRSRSRRRTELQDAYMARRTAEERGS